MNCTEHFATPEYCSFYSPARTRPRNQLFSESSLGWLPDHLPCHKTGILTLCCSRKYKSWFCLYIYIYIYIYISLTVHLGIILVNNQLDALFSMYLFISLLCVFRATQCSSSGESNCINTSSGIYHSV